MCLRVGHSKICPNGILIILLKLIKKQSVQEHADSLKEENKPPMWKVLFQYQEAEKYSYQQIRAHKAV